MKARIILIVACILLIAGLLYIRFSPSAAGDGHRSRNLPVVAVAKAQRTDDRTFRRNHSRTATLSPDQRLTRKSPGYLKTSSMSMSADRVKAGEVIAQLETPEEEADVARAQTTFNDLQKLDYDPRTNPSFTNGPACWRRMRSTRRRPPMMSPRPIWTMRRSWPTTPTITAPFDGVVTKRTADPGALIQAGTSTAQAAAAGAYFAEDDASCA